MSSINITTLKRLLWPSEVKMLLSIAIGVFAIVGLFKLYGYWDNYRDRPLAEGFTYVGRDYESGCDLFICMGSRNEALYYATDVEPEDAAMHFTGWSLNDLNREVDTYSTVQDYQKASSSYVCSDLVKGVAIQDKYSNRANICYAKHPSASYELYNLKPIHKKHLVSVGPNSYERLTSHEP